MGICNVLRLDHFRASSLGYKSGRNSYRGTPESLSTSRTRNGGTADHCETADLLMFSAAAKRLPPPAFRIARSSGVSMRPMSSTASHQSQAPLHLPPKTFLYSSNMNWGTLIARGRKAKKLSLQALADKLGVSRQAVWQWEKNETVPNHEKLELICRILEISYDELYGPQITPSSALESKIGMLSADRRAHIEALVDALLMQQERDIPHKKKNVK